MIGLMEARSVRLTDNNEHDIAAIH